MSIFVWQEEWFLQKGFAEAAIFCCQLYHLRKETIWGDDLAISFILVDFF